MSLYSLSLSKSESGYTGRSLLCDVLLERGPGLVLFEEGT